MSPRMLMMALALVGCRVEEPWGKSPDPFAWPPEACTEGGSSATLLSAGTLDGAAHWLCNDPEPIPGAPLFTGYDGYTGVVNGGTASLQLYGQVPAERWIYLGVYGEAGYFAYKLTEGTAPHPLNLSISPTAPFDSFIVWVAADDGTGSPSEPHSGELLEIPFNLVRVQTGDVQVNVNWDSATDVDLYVVDPDGSELFYGNTSVASGGQLDLDSNAGCTDGPQNENIFWPSGGAPNGSYQVRLNYWSACTHNGATNYRVTAVSGGEVVYSESGQFHPQDAYQGGSGAGQLLTTFSFVRGAPDAR